MREPGKSRVAAYRIVSAILAGKNAQFISPARGRCVWIAKLVVTLCPKRPEYSITEDKTTGMFILTVKGFLDVQPKSS